MAERLTLIVGAGIGGITTALCLARRGFPVRVMEQAAAIEEVGAGIQLSPNGTRVFHDLGLERALRDIAFIPEGSEMRHWRTGAVFSAAALGDAALERYGYPYYHVHRADLMGILLEAARAEPSIELVTRARIDRIEQTPSSVTAVCGDERHEGEVLIGADGIHSTVRESLFGPEAPRFTGNVAWRALIPSASLPPGLVRPTATAWWGPHKHFVHYYVRGGALVNCVCVVEKRGWEIESWAERGDRGELERDFAGWHESVCTLIDLMDREACFKWALFDRPPMPRWGAGRVTLLGDACHPTLPFMAQGAAMAIEDAAVLARCVDGVDAVSARLQRYETLRRRRTAWVQAGSRRNARVFHLTGPLAWLRNRVAGRFGQRVMDELYRYDALRADASD